MNKKILITIVVLAVIAGAAWFFQQPRQDSGSVTQVPAPSTAQVSTAPALGDWVNKSGPVDSFSGGVLTIKTSDSSSFSCQVSSSTKISFISVGKPIKGDTVITRSDTDAISVLRGVALSDVTAGPSLFVGSVVSVGSDSIVLRNASGIEKTVAIGATSTSAIQKKGTTSDIKAGVSVNVSCLKSDSTYVASTVLVFTP